MKILLLQAWHFLESVKRYRRCFRQTDLCKEQLNFYNANTKCLFFLLCNPSFSLWSHLQEIFGRFWYEAGGGVSLSLSPFFFIFTLILSMSLLFLIVFSGVSAPWEDNEAFQKAFPCPNPSEYKLNIDLFRRSQDCKRVFTQETDPMTAVQWRDSGVTAVNTL